MCLNTNFALFVSISISLSLKPSLSLSLALTICLPLPLPLHPLPYACECEYVCLMYKQPARQRAEKYEELRTQKMENTHRKKKWEIRKYVAKKPLLILLFSSFLYWLLSDQSQFRFSTVWLFQEIVYG